MAFNYSPKIVTDGLVMCLDASNTRSYPGSGTTWSDLSRSGNNGTLTNGPTFNSANGGSIVFDGTNDFYAPNGNTFGYSPGATGEISLEMWIYPTGPYTIYASEPPTTNLAGFFGQSYFNNSSGWGLGVLTQNGVNYWAWQVRNAGTIVQPSFVSAGSFVNNNWYHVVGTFARNSYSILYVNGISVSSVSSIPLNGITITPSLLDAAIGKGGGFPFYAGFRMGIAKIYNRALSSTEVLQNFNATKTRFGF